MVLKIHFISHWLWRMRVPLVPRFLQGVLRIIFSVALPPSVRLGRNVVLGYSGLATVIHARAVIGDGVNIGSGVTIGGRSGHYEVPVIDADVEIGSGAKVLGPIHIGKGAVIGANAVVISDVAERTVVAGVPARLIKTIGADLPR